MVWLEWTEEGGPVAIQPKAHGFGSGVNHAEPEVRFRLHCSYFCTRRPAMFHHVPRVVLREAAF
jgi:hypothetical protein